jgi:hypothetical protein
MITPTLTLKSRKLPSANQRAISPHARDLKDLRDLRLRQIQLIRETRSPCLKPLLSSPFYLTTNQRSMDSEDHTESSLTTEPENLTELHQLSGLPTKHESRRTTQGFLIRGDRLPNCVPLPGTKNTLRSWIWQHGWYIGYKNDNKEVTKQWLCKICEDKQPTPPLSTFMICTEKTTTKVIDHLEDLHQFDRSGSKLLLDESKKRKRAFFESWNDQQDTYNSIFDEEGWRYTFCRWVVGSGISLRRASSDDLKALLCFQNPRVEAVVPQSVSTIRRWLMADFAKYKQTIIRSIASAKGKVTISFDGWKANNNVLDLLGVVIHYLGDDYKLHNVVLAMCNTLGSHTGANIADHLFDVLKEYQISGSQIAYFAADNATNNDAALKHLSKRVTLDPVTSRLRCAGHIYNLVCTAILFGVDSEALEDAKHDFSQLQDDSEIERVIDDLDNASRNGSEEQQHRAQQRHGPIGKLHNLVTHIKANNSRITLFESKQREATMDGEAEKVLRLVTNGGIRWNSTYLMIERAVKLKDALTLYQADEASTILEDDLLTKDDWYELCQFRDLLEPIHEVSKLVQSIGTTAGALHNTLTSMDYLLHHLEERRSQPGSPFFMACLNVGWLKLKKYYAVTDLNPAYILAVFLNPHYRQIWFEEHWAETPEFVKIAKATVDEQYAAAKRTYNIDAPERSSTSPQAKRKELKGYAAWNKKRSQSQFTDTRDELIKYRNIQDPPDGQDPLDWWKLHQDDYPVLKHLAFTTLAAPASTATDERLFSIAGNFVNEERPLTKQDLAEAEQCLRSWYAEGLI